MNPQRKINPLWLLSSFVFVPLVANIIAVSNMIALTDYLFLPERLAELATWEKENPFVSRLTIAFPFIISFLLITMYSTPVFTSIAKFNRGEELTDSTKKRLINSSFIISLISLISWCIAPLERELILHTLSFKFQIESLIKNILISFTNGLVTFIIIYYILESITKKIYIPQIHFKDKFSNLKGLLQISIHGRFLIYTVSVSITPIVVLFLALYTVDHRLVLLGQESLLSVFITIVIVLISITLLLMSMMHASIHHPLDELAEATESIESGNLNVHVNVFSTDEVGKLGERFNQMISGLREREKFIAKNTELEEALKKLKAAQKQIIVQEKMASLGTLTAGIAHEIKNPLNFVNNFSSINNDLTTELQQNLEILKNKYLGTEDTDNRETKELQTNAFEELIELAEDIKMNTTKINEHGNRADHIVNTMLQHSRGGSGEKTMTDVNNLLSEAVKLAYHGLRALDTTFNVTIEESYDRSIKNMEIISQDVNRVFLNILNNAMYSANQKSKNNKENKSTSTNQDDEPPTITITTKKPDKQQNKNSSKRISICIRDNGSGISKDNLENIFEPFFTTKPAGYGTGLGLSISYDIIVNEHDGELNVNTKEGEYCEFEILI